MVYTIEEIQKKNTIVNKLKNDDLNKDELKKLEKSITDTKIKISKCNMIWSNLLKGKKWDDISVILTTGNFTSKDGKITKIKNLLKINNEKEVQAEVEEEVENGLAKNVKDILGKVTAKGNEILNKKEEKEEDNKLPVEVKSFEERHPKLAKIPFLAKFMNWRETKKLEKQGKQENKENNETQDSPKTEVVDKKALEYIDKQMKTREEEMFKSIAEKGFRESIKADVSERLAKQKVEAANKYAEKYGTKYKEQDGAEK